MAEQQTSPTLDQYPGYFPAAKPPFWTRWKVAIVAAMVGLVVGLAGASGGAEGTKPEQASPPGPSQAQIQSQIDDAVAAAEARVSGQVRTVRADAQQRLASVRSQIAVVRSRAAASERQAVRAAVARTRAEDHAKLVAAVSNAKASAASHAAAPAPVATNGGGGTDPHFSYCYEAIAAGYGPYIQGQDPEYDWYTDADGDGVVCE